MPYHLNPRECYPNGAAEGGRFEGCGSRRQFLNILFRTTPVSAASRGIGNALRLLGVSPLGCVLSLVLYQIWDLETRWAVVVFVAIMGITVSMCFARVF